MFSLLSNMTWISASLTNIISFLGSFSLRTARRCNWFEYCMASLWHVPVLDCFHMTAKCVFWILIRNAHFELRSVHTIEVLAYFELRSIHTSDRNMIVLSRAWRRDVAVSGFPANQRCLRFLCMCSALCYRRKWLEGHTSSAPQNTI